MGDRPGYSAVILWGPSPGSNASLCLLNELGECFASHHGSEDDIGGEVRCAGSE